jgi:hypothetical protein
MGNANIPQTHKDINYSTQKIKQQSGKKEVFPKERKDYLISSEKKLKDLDKIFNMQYPSIK